jgi:hypothetical protein
MLLAGIVRMAIRDAQQTKDARLREDALRWLWWRARRNRRRAQICRRLCHVALHI